MKRFALIFNYILTYVAETIPLYFGPTFWEEKFVTKDTVSTNFISGFSTEKVKTSKEVIQ